MSYTLWLVPQEASVKSYLSTTVNELAAKYQGPPFEPHTTLLGDQPLSLDEIKDKSDLIAKQTAPFSVNTSTVEYSTTYYQCVFVRLKPTPELMSLYMLAKQVFNLTQPSVFMPHISLFYGNHDFEKRHQICQNINFQPQQFTLSSLIVTPGGEHPPSAWEHLYEVAFTAPN